MSNASDFVIENGYLKEYLGSDETVVVPKDVVWVNSVFKNNPNIKKIVFGENVLYISAGAFDGSNNIVEYEVSECNPEYCSVGGIIFTKDMKKLVAFPIGRGGEYTIPEGVEEIGAYAFYGNCEISAVHLPESVLVIGSGAFEKCDGIKNFYIPKNVVDMACTSTFGCNMENIDINPENKKYASFDGMVFSAKFKNLQYCPPKKKGEVILPKTVSGINTAAFKNCSQITKIEIPEKVTKIGVNAFYNCSALTKITIPESVTTIKNGAFWACTGLEEISLPEKITTVEARSFEGCKNLTRVTLPDGLLTIEGNAFNGCDSLEEILLPSHVSKLGEDVFSSNTAVICPAEIFKRLSTMTKEKTCIKYLEKSGQFSEKLSEVIIAYIKRNRTVFFERLIKEGNTSAFNSCLALFEVKKTIIDECLALASRYNRPEFNFALLEHANKKTEQQPKTEIGNISCEDAVEESGMFVMSSKDAKKLFRFSETPNGAIINGYKGNEVKVIIPDRIGEYSVVGIKKDAFACNETIEEVVLPDSITKIDGAFRSCPRLTKINLPTALVELGGAAFAWCPKLQRTAIPAGLKKISDEAFSGCPSFSDENGFVIAGAVLFGYYGKNKRVVVPDGIKTVGLFAFREKQIVEVILPKTVKKLGHEAFRNCPLLERIHATKRLSSIVWDAISGCPKLTIHAPAGSYAEKYAKINKIPFVAE